MSFVVVLLALGLLMLVAYRGFSVILFAPICAMLAVALTDPTLVLPMFSGVFMDKMVGFVKLYLPVFLLGAVFGKVIELSGSARSIVTAVMGQGIEGSHPDLLRRDELLRAARPGEADGHPGGPHPRHAVDRGGVRALDLRRSFAFRRGVRGLSLRRGDVPPGRLKTAAVAVAIGTFYLTGIY